MSNIRVYKDESGKFFDCFTVMLGDDVFTMSEDPLSPHGVNQWAGNLSDFPKPQNDSERKLKPNEIPDQIKQAIIDRLQG